MPGPKGDKGDSGPAGISGYEAAIAIQPTLAPGAQASATAACPTGKKALGGGFSTGGDYFTVRESR